MNEIVKGHTSHKSILATLASLLACFALVMALVPMQAIAAGEEDTTNPPTTEQPGGDENQDGTTGGDTEGDDTDEPTDVVEIAVPTAAKNLTYTGQAQKLLPQNKGYTVELVLDDEQEPGTGDEGTGDENKPGTGDENTGDEQDPTTPDTPAAQAEGDDATEGDDTTGDENTGDDATEGDKPEAPKQEIDIETDKDNVLATNAGTYNLKVTLNKGYAWQGGGTTDQNFEVVIAAADINKATTATVANVTFMGEPVEPEVTVAMANGTKLVKDVDYTLEYVDNDQIGTATVIIKGIGNFTGTKVAQFQIGEHQAMYRVYNPNSGEHFYTASEFERDHLIELGWKNEQVGWYAPVKSDAPVFRLYNPNAGEHHFTMSAVERDALVKEGWNDEGIGWYSDENQTVKVLRQYNPNAYANNHNYTTSQYEFDHNISLGWQDEGIAWYAAAEGGDTEADAK
ncbi:MAG: hypothetical protein V8R08_06855 [Coriobacteriales bacterium]